MGLIDSALNGATATISTSVTPDVNVDVGGAVQPGPPNPILAFLKPKIVVSQAGIPLFQVAPYGTPDVVDWDTVIIFGVIGIVLITLLLSKRR